MIFLDGVIVISVETRRSKIASRAVVRRYDVETTTYSRARIVQLAKTKAITYLLTYATAFSGRHLMSPNAKALKFTKQRTLSS